MNVFTILKFLFSRNRVRSSKELFDEIFGKYLPNFSEIKRAIVEVGENWLYITYQLKSIEFNLEDLEQDLNSLKYEVKSVKRSVDRYKNRLTIPKVF